MAKSRQPNVVADFLAAAFAPALVMGMIYCLISFLILVFYRDGFQVRVNYLFALYIFASVLIARIAIDSGRAHALGYTVALGASTLFVISRFVVFQGPLASLSPLINAGLLALVGFLADRIVFDCTLIESDRDTSGEGLLQSLGLVRSDLAKAPVGKSKRRRRHNPGVSILYFALLAIPLYGVGQIFLPSEATGVRERAFYLLFGYFACSFSLLVTTSFLGLRRYLSQRGVEIPFEFTVNWLGMGLLGTLLFLGLCMLLPLPGREYGLFDLPFDIQSSEGLSASRYGWGGEGAGDGSGAAPTAPYPSPGSPSNVGSAGSEGTNGSGGTAGSEGSQGGSAGQGEGGSSSGGESAQGGETASSNPNSSKDGSQEGTNSESTGGNRTSSNSDSGRQAEGMDKQGNDSSSASQNSSGQASGSPNSQSNSKSSNPSAPQANAPNGSRSTSNPSSDRGSQNNPGQSTPDQTEPSQGDRTQSSNRPYSQKTNSSPQANRGQNQSTRQQGESQNDLSQNDLSQDAQQQSPQQPESQTPGSQNQSQPTESRSSDSQQPESQQPESQQPESQQPESQSSESPTPTEPNAPWMNFELASWLGPILKWVTIAALLGFFAYYAITHRAEIAVWLAGIKKWWNSLWGLEEDQTAEVGGESASQKRKQRTTFASFSNPFRNRESKKDSSELVRYTYAAIEAWGAERGVIRAEGQTAEEYLRRLSGALPKCQEELTNLANAYTRLAYAGRRAILVDMQSLQKLWMAMEQIPATPSTNSAV
jgi:hypothetical protein